jgi:hypothetical protein
VQVDIFDRDVRSAQIKSDSRDAVRPAATFKELATRLGVGMHRESVAAEADSSASRQLSSTIDTA